MFQILPTILTVSYVFFFFQKTFKLPTARAVLTAVSPTRWLQCASLKCVVSSPLFRARSDGAGTTFRAHSSLLLSSSMAAGAHLICSVMDESRAAVRRRRSWRARGSSWCRLQYQSLITEINGDAQARIQAGQGGRQQRSAKKEEIKKFKKKGKRKKRGKECVSPAALAFY